MMQRSRLDRRALFASGAAAALLAATGVSAQASPAHGGRLRVALSGALRNDSFDPRQPQGLFMQVASSGAVFDTLTEVAADGTLRGELATGWRGDPQAQIWTIDLREGVRFHNGLNFGAPDVVASFALHRETILSDIVEVRVLTAHRIQVVLAAGDTEFPYRLSTPSLIMLPAEQMAAAMEDGIGTGLYRTHRFLPGRQFVGLRVEDHYKTGRAGWFDSVELVSIPAGLVRAEALRGRFVDAADIEDGAALDGENAFALLPFSHTATHAVHSSIALPAQVGTHAPLDNLRAAERWWMA
jgi:ABC-type transport system substrate-binding protein